MGFGSNLANWILAAASLDHDAHTALVAQGFGAGVGRIGDWYEQGSVVRWDEDGLELSPIARRADPSESGTGDPAA